MLVHLLLLLTLLASRVSGLRGNVNDDNCINGAGPGTHRLVIQPEGHPGHGDRHGAGDVHRHDEEGELAGKQHLDPETGVGAWREELSELIGILIKYQALF